MLSHTALPGSSASGEASEPVSVICSVQETKARSSALVFGPSFEMICGAVGTSVAERYSTHCT